MLSVTEYLVFNLPKACTVVDRRISTKMIRQKNKWNLLLNFILNQLLVVQSFFLINLKFFLILSHLRLLIILRNWKASYLLYNFLFNTYSEYLGVNKKPVRSIKKDFTNIQLYTVLLKLGLKFSVVSTVVSGITFARFPTVEQWSSHSKFFGQ